VGRAASAVVEGVREKVAALVGFSPRDVVFTSGGTEANNLALWRPFWSDAGHALEGLCVTSRAEHPSVTAVAELLGRRGIRIAWLDVQASGTIDPADVDRALALHERGPRLVALQAVNHETGVIQPLQEVARIVQRRGAEFHVDAVQAVGRLESTHWQGADSIALTAHKMRGPKGIGALAVRAGLTIKPLLRGGGQERGLRPGTVDPVMAAGFGVAAERARGGPLRYRALASLRSALEEALTAIGDRIGARPLVNGIAPRAPHVSNLSWPGWAGDELVAALDLEGVCVSAGSACAAGTPEPSRVIAAMLGEGRAKSAVRVSLGEETTRANVEAAIVVFERVLARHPSR
jgi:cysteine desulfurase